MSTVYVMTSLCLHCSADNGVGLGQEQIVQLYVNCEYCVYNDVMSTVYVMTS